MDTYVSPEKIDFVLGQVRAKRPLFGSSLVKTVGLDDRTIYNYAIQGDAALDALEAHLLDYKKNVLDTVRQKYPSLEEKVMRLEEFSDNDIVGAYIKATLDEFQANVDAKILEIEERDTRMKAVKNLGDLPKDVYGNILSRVGNIASVSPSYAKAVEESKHSYSYWIHKVERQLEIESLREVEGYDWENIGSFINMVKRNHISSKIKTPGVGDLGRLYFLIFRHLPTVQKKYDGIQVMIINLLDKAHPELFKEVWDKLSNEMVHVINSTNVSRDMVVIFLENCVMNQIMIEMDDKQSLSFVRFGDIDLIRLASNVYIDLMFRKPEELSMILMTRSLSYIKALVEEKFVRRDHLDSSDVDPMALISDTLKGISDRNKDGDDVANYYVRGSLKLLGDGDNKLTSMKSLEAACLTGSIKMVTLILEIAAFKDINLTSNRHIVGDILANMSLSCMHKSFLRKCQYIIEGEAKSNLHANTIVAIEDLRKRMKMKEKRLLTPDHPKIIKLRAVIVLLLEYLRKNDGLVFIPGLIKVSRNNDEGLIAQIIQEEFDNLGM